MQRRWKGIVEDHVTMKSKKKGTPGIEFLVMIREQKIGTTFEPCQWFERTVAVYFSPGGDHSWSLKKLAFAGYVEGTPLSEMNLCGNTVELVSEPEIGTDGKEREKFELALPPRGMSQADDDAELAIDAILSSSPIENIKLPSQLDADAAPDPNAKPAGSIAGGSRDTSAGSPAEVPPESNFDDDVPF